MKTPAWRRRERPWKSCGTILRQTRRVETSRRSQAGPDPVPAPSRPWHPAHCERRVSRRPVRVRAPCKDSHRCAAMLGEHRRPQKGSRKQLQLRAWYRSRLPSDGKESIQAPIAEDQLAVVQRARSEPAACGRPVPHFYWFHNRGNLLFRWPGNPISGNPDLCAAIGTATARNSASGTNSSSRRSP